MTCLLSVSAPVVSVSMVTIIIVIVYLFLLAFECLVCGVINYAFGTLLITLKFLAP